MRSSIPKALTAVKAAKALDKLCSPGTFKISLSLTASGEVKSAFWQMVQIIAESSENVINRTEKIEVFLFNIR